MIRNSALSIYQLMGAPLKALVEAETQAAQATADFIKRIGFEPPAENEENDDTQFGKLRMVTFFHEKRGPNGQVRQIKIEVPLLSLVPIPALQIKDAEIDFSVLILDELKVTEKSELESAPQRPGDRALAPMNMKDIGGGGLRQLKGTFGSSQGETSKRNSLEAQMRVKIRMEQSDIPTGLGKLFHIMEQNVTVVEEDPKHLEAGNN